VRAQAYVEEALGWLSETPQEAPTASGVEDLTVAQAAAKPADQLVLLADDNADMRRYVERLLTQSGYRVRAVADGQAALAEARRLQPDLVLSDVMMPRLDGFGLVAKLRQEQSLKDTPVILLSARAGEEAKIEGLRAGADDYLVKPFSARELLARVETNLKLAGIRRDSARILHEEAEILELLNEVGTALAAEIDLERAVQVVTDAATRLSGAAFGLYGAFLVKGAAARPSLSFFAFLGAISFVRPRRGLSSAPTQDAKADARSGCQGRCFFSAARGACP
jgi:DNA-binding response OmpR family regulator